VLLGPVADRRELGAEGIGDDVLGISDEDGSVADPGEAGDVLDHLGVVVGGEEGLALAAVRDRQPADEVRQLDVRGRLQLRVLVQEVVDLPGLVSDSAVVRLLADDIVEEHEVGDQDLVHPAGERPGVNLPNRLLAGPSTNGMLCISDGDGGGAAWPRPARNRL
jgi:hypothetical protein